MAKRAGKIQPLFVWKDAGNGRSYMQTDMGHQFYHTDERGRVKVPHLHNDSERHVNRLEGQGFASWSREDCELDYAYIVRDAEETYEKSMENGVFNPIFGEELADGDYARCSHVLLTPRYMHDWSFQNLAVQSEYFSQAWLASNNVVRNVAEWFKGESPCDKLQNNMDFIVTDFEEAICPDTTDTKAVADRDTLLDHGGCIHLGDGDGMAIRVDIPVSTVSHMQDGKITDSVNNKKASRPTNEQKTMAEKAHAEIKKMLLEEDKLHYESDIMRKYGEYYASVLDTDPMTGRKFAEKGLRIEEIAEREAEKEDTDDISFA